MSQLNNDDKFINLTHFKLHGDPANIPHLKFGYIIFRVSIVTLLFPSLNRPDIPYRLTKEATKLFRNGE